MADREADQEARIKKLEEAEFGKAPPGPEPTPTPVKPDEGVVKQGGNQDTKTWKIVNMRDNPALFKIVDDQDKNIATDFTTKEKAQQYVDYYSKTVPVTPPTPTPEPPTPIPPTGTNTTKSGIKLLATPKPGGYSWELDLSKDPNSDACFDPEGGKCTAGQDGNVKFWNMKGKTVNYRSGGTSGITNRLGIYFPGGKGSKQTHTWKNQTGFLWKESDPKNYVVISTIRPHHSLASNIHHESSIKNRGGNHSSSAPDNASTFELTQEMKGDSPRFAREYTHPQYDYKPVDEAGPDAKNLGIVVDKWFMRQLISKELPDGTGVSYEYYINTNPFNADGTINNYSWQLYSKTVDKDGVNTGKYKVAAKWSGWVTTARIDGFEDIDISHHAFIEIA